MAPQPRYARASDDDEDVGMISESRNPTYQPPQKNTPWWKYAAAAGVFIALFIPAVGYTSSVMIESRVDAAVREALSTQNSGNTSQATTPAASTDSKESAKVVEEPETGLITLSNGTTIEYGNPYSGKKYEMHDCGSNADEARALGCSYDVMMQEWTPPECIDWTLSEKFLEKGNWTWYADSSGATTFDAVEVALGNHDVVYVDQSYHRHHCIMTWERLVRALRTQRPLIEKLINYDHVMHCRMNTLKTFEEGAQPVRGVVAPTAFTKCASLDVWLANLPENKHSSIEKMLKMI